MHHRKLVDVLRGQELQYVDSATSVQAAAEKMAASNVAALLIMDNGQLSGIFTERDLLRRVVVAGLNPVKTPIGTVMTKDMVTLDGERLGFEAVRLMTEMNIRHLAVTGLGGNGYGIVSTRDFPHVEMATFQREIEREQHIWTSI